jgi:hypothetical protein
VARGCNNEGCISSCETDTVLIFCPSWCNMSAYSSKLSMFGGLLFCPLLLSRVCIQKFLKYLTLPGCPVTYCSISARPSWYHLTLITPRQPLMIQTTMSMRNITFPSLYTVSMWNGILHWPKQDRAEDFWCITSLLEIQPHQTFHLTSNLQ